MNPIEPQFPELLRRVLESRKFMLQHTVSQQAIDNTSIEVERLADRMMDQLSVRLHMKLYGERIGNAEAEESMTFPTTWWQHLKKDFAPAWFLARWPVKTNTWKLRVTANKWRMYPQVKDPLPASEYGRPVVVIDPSSWSAWE